MSLTIREILSPEMAVKVARQIQRRTSFIGLCVHSMFTRMPEPGEDTDDRPNYAKTFGDQPDEPIIVEGKP